MKKVAVVSKDENLRLYLNECVPRGYIVTYYKRIIDVTRTRNSESYSLGIVDADHHYHELLLHYKKGSGIHIPWIALASGHNVGKLLNITGSFICDIIQKPINREQFRLSVFRLMIDTHFRDPDYPVNDRLRTLYIGRSSKAVQIRQRIHAFARASAPVLITGESGTGKEVVAKCIAETAAPRGNTFFPLNLAAIPRDLVESTLFGAVPGAYTGARDTPGLFETSGTGTVLLDEIGELGLTGQTKLLRILETGDFYRLGSTERRQVQCRIISATNRDLRYEVENGAFREDLYYRLKVLHIHIPPLRERTRDIPLLITHFLDILECTITHRALVYLTTRRWPGNVRQLYNTIKRGSLLCTDRKIDIKDLLEH